MIFRRVPKIIHDLERRGLLSLNAEWIDRVYQRDLPVSGHFFDQFKRLIKIPLDHNDFGTVAVSLQKLPFRDLSLRDQHIAFQPAAAGVGRGRCGRIACRGAHHGLRAGFHRFRDRHGHPAILERPGRIQPLELVINPDILQPQLKRQGFGQNERRIPFIERNNRRLVRNGKKFLVPLNDPYFFNSVFSHET